MDKIKTIQDAIATSEFDAWLFYDFRGSDPLAYSVLGLDPKGHYTRRWYYLIPKTGEPIKLTHRIESLALSELPGKALQYSSWRELEEQLKILSAGISRIAMQYSENNSIPYLSRVDAGTVEQIRSFGIEVCSAKDLLQRFNAVLSPDQLSSHKLAGDKISKIIDETFGEIENRFKRTASVSEYEIQQYMFDQILAAGMETDHPPVVAFAANSANPHYCPQKEGSAVLVKDNLVLLDIWAKVRGEDNVYFDVTWVACMSSKVPERVQEIFTVVKNARDAAINLVQKNLSTGHQVQAYLVDDAARNVINKAGYGEYFIHRTGHSIFTQVHGNGANIDNFETRDDRYLIQNTLFSIEPGIYLPGEFGIRSEVDVYVSDKNAEVTVRPAQMEVICLG